MNNLSRTIEWGASKKDIDLDVCVVAINRPMLLNNTLASFSKRIFCDWPNCRIVMNVDPVPFGVIDTEFIKIAQKYFKQGIVRFTSNGDFSEAVKWTWLTSCSSTIFHLEDDWICLSKIKKSKIESILSEKSKTQVVLPKRHQLFLTNGFSLNPSFLKGSWARSIASQLVPGLDPEKQIRHGVSGVKLNGTSENVSQFYRTVSMLPVIFDSGSLWKEKVGMTKHSTPDFEVTWLMNDAKKQLIIGKLPVKIKLFYCAPTIVRIVQGFGQLIRDLYRILQIK